MHLIPDRRACAARVWLLLAVCMAALAVSGGAARIAIAADTPLEFADPAQQARYQALISNLRCLVCQNQTLADSEADLAQDLREQIYERMNQGASDKDIIDFLLARYGDFVLYNPPLQENTWILWFGPFVLLAAAAAVFIRVARASRAADAPVLSDAEQKQFRELIAGSDKKGSAE